MESDIKKKKKKVMLCPAVLIVIGEIVVLNT